MNEDNLNTRRHKLIIYSASKKSCFGDPFDDGKPQIVL